MSWCFIKKLAGLAKKTYFFKFSSVWSSTTGCGLRKCLLWRFFRLLWERPTKHFVRFFVHLATTSRGLTSQTEGGLTLVPPSKHVWGENFRERSVFLGEFFGPWIKERPGPGGAPVARVGIKRAPGGLGGTRSAHALWPQLARKNVDPPTDILIWSIIIWNPTTCG